MRWNEPAYVPLEWHPMWNLYLVWFIDEWIIFIIFYDKRSLYFRWFTIGDFRLTVCGSRKSYARVVDATLLASSVSGSWRQSSSMCVASQAASYHVKVAIKRYSEWSKWGVEGGQRVIRNCTGGKAQHGHEDLWCPISFPLSFIWH